MSWRSADDAVNPSHLSTADAFGFLTEASWAVETVTAAVQLGVLDRLDSGWVSSEELASAFGMTRYQGRLLLTALARLGLARAADEERFTSAVAGPGALARRLLPDGRLANVLVGNPPRIAADTSDGSARLYPDMVRFLASGFRAAASVAADELARSGLRVLDLGAGAAPWSLAVAERDDSIRVVAIDLPEVIPVTISAVEEAGLDGRFDLVTGDLFEIDLGEQDYDLVIAGGICHLFDEESNRRLLGQVSRALAPGGTLAVMEPLPNENLDGPRSVLLYALDLTTRTARGSVYPFSTYATWLQSSGLTRVRRADLSDSPPISLITAEKPESGGV